MAIGHADAPAALLSREVARELSFDETVSVGGGEYEAAMNNTVVGTDCHASYTQDCGWDGLD